MRKFSTLVALTVAALVATVAVATAAPPPTAPGKNPLTCFGEPAACTTNGKTSATLNTNNGGAGVYFSGFNNSFYGVRTNLVTKLSNNVSGSTLGIDPHWAIPINDVDRGEAGGPDGYTDYFVFVSFANCNNGAGLVDVLNDTTCTIDMGDGTNTSFPNWKAFYAAHPNTYIASKDNYAFIIADLSGPAGIWTISNVQIGKPGK